MCSTESMKKKANKKGQYSVNFRQWQALRRQQVDERQFSETLSRM
jgi:tRNA G37 N-methylase TrmD